jgi:molecular chaperone HtpG
MLTDIAIAPDNAKVTLGFQAEVKQLLRLMIHSLYSHKEIFLRELISNASDACDKLRFEALSNAALNPNGDLAITIDTDSGANTITIADGGIGMTRQDAVDHLGTIAKSGTAEYLLKLSGDQKKDSQLIGQFGVGFYSAFIVANRVEVFSRRAGAAASEGVHWESKGEGEFSVEDIELERSGTRVVLHLKDDQREFANDYRIRSLVKRFSDHIAVPVKMRALKKVEAGDEDALDVVDDESNESPAVAVYETINQALALWLRPRNEVTDSEYKEFYQHVTHDFVGPLAWTHNKLEGSREYTTLLYIPSRAPYDSGRRDSARGVTLYVRRVFIMDDAEQFLPLYLRFIKGVVDSSDLPLNVSRESLQHDSQVEAIKSAITKRSLDLLTKLANEEKDKYAVFWKEFGSVLKEGPAEDYANRERVAKLLRFSSTFSDKEEQDVSLDDYVSRMKPGQECVFYLVGDTFTAARSSAHLEQLRSKGIEVLLLNDRIDEWLTDHLREFDGKKLRNVARGDLDLSGIDANEDKSERESMAVTHQAIADRIKKILVERVADVKVTTRLIESPAILVLSGHDMGAQMRRILEASGQNGPSTKPTLEINPKHALLRRIESLGDGDRFADMSLMLFEQATLADGGRLAEPGEFVRRINRLLLSSMMATDDIESSISA